MNTATHETPTGYRYPNRTDKVQAVRRIRDGATVHEIADQFKVSNIMVMGWLKEYDKAASSPDPVETIEVIPDPEPLVLETALPPLESETQAMAKKTPVTRKSFTDAQKQDAVNQLMAGAKTTAVAKKLGVTTNSIYAWKEKFGAGKPSQKTTDAGNRPAAKAVAGTSGSFNSTDYANRSRLLESIVIDQLVEIQRLKGKLN